MAPAGKKLPQWEILVIAEITLEIRDAKYLVTLKQLPNSKCQSLTFPLIIEGTQC